jgi:uncharacterized membrane protein YozB (DUF420 family)
MNWVSTLPTVNATLNGTAALLLLAGFACIRARRLTAHRNCMLAAFGVSALFLASYLCYHYYHGATQFTAGGLVRIVYFTILISHTILAVVVVPLVLRTIYLAGKGRLDRHKRIARWTLPIWLYVSVTGVVIYVMLYHLYPAG